ncbi:MAG: threonine-phosphate decarboxylase [Candidatus Omnitrophica bacterium]|nr:threonine-phosphate decarboxylase [Candidatus Omnitrophota bacterium]
MAYIDYSHGGNIYEIEQRCKRSIIDFSANINPLGLPPAVEKSIFKNLDKILHYPDLNATSITRKIAKHWGISSNNILLGNGSAELIYLIVTATRPKTTLIPVPTFSEYERAARNVKSRIEFLRLKEGDGFKLDLSCLNRTDLTFICNPNNPTGNLVLGDRLKVRRPLVIDEAFMDFLPNQRDYTLIREAARSKKIFVLRTFTKFFALPGLRLGYLITHKDNVERLRRFMLPWNTNSLAQIASESILKDRPYIKKTYQLIERERGFLFEQLNKTGGLKPYPAVANFILIKIERNGITSRSLKDALIKRGVLIRDCSNFRNLNNKYIRVAVRLRNENLKLLEALKTSL